MINPENRKVSGSFSLEQNIIKGIKKLAKQDDRNFSSFVNIILRNFLEKHAKKKMLKRRK